MLKGGQVGFPFNRGLSATREKLSIWNYVKKNGTAFRRLNPGQHIQPMKRGHSLQSNSKRTRLQICDAIRCILKQLAGANGDGHQMVLFVGMPKAKV